MNDTSVYFIVLSLLVLCMKHGNAQSNEAALEAHQLRGRYQFTVSIRNFNRSDCGGALIGSHTVLTTAECVDKRYGREKLPYMWLNATETENRTEGTMPRQAVDVRIHPNYTGDILDGYDFAILLLNETADPLRSVSPGHPQYDNAEPGITLTFLSFARSTGSSSRSRYMQPTTHEIIEPATCQNSDDLVFLGNATICLEGDTPCSGDQGGLLFQDRGARHGNTLYGIASESVCDLNSTLVSVPSIVDPEIAPWINATRREFEARMTDVTPEEEVEAYFAALNALGAEGPVTTEDILEIIDEGDP